MGCEMAAAVGSATVHGGVLFGQNIQHVSPYRFWLSQEQGGTHSPEEILELTHTQIPQAERTFAVLGCRSEPTWGFQYGLNEKGLAVGSTTWRCKIGTTDSGLTGADLVRLTLERAHHVERGLDVLTELLGRYGESAGVESLGHVFFLADSQSAFVVEAAGPFWSASEIRHVRAACDAAIIRQDWQLIAPGLADLAVEQGWAMPDGSKLDFAGALQQDSPELQSALKRWARVTVLLEQHSGNIDAGVMRRILSDHFDGTPSEIDPLKPPVHPQSVCRHAAGEQHEQTVASVTADLPAAIDHLPVLWSCVGPPCLGVYLPFFPIAPVPQASYTMTDRVFAAVENLAASVDDWTIWQNRMEALQSRIQRQTDEFLAETKRSFAANESRNLGRQCQMFTQNILEQLEVELDLLDSELADSPPKVAGKEA